MTSRLSPLVGAENKYDHLGSGDSAAMLRPAKISEFSVKNMEAEGSARGHGALK